MNLQPINPPEPVFQFGCYSCGRPFLSTTPGDGETGERVTDVNWEDAHLCCAACGDRIESAYAEPEEEEES